MAPQRQLEDQDHGAAIKGVAAAKQALERAQELVDGEGTPEGALEIAEIALGAFDEIGDPHGVADAMRVITHACRWRADLLKASGSREKAKEVMKDAEHMLEDQRQIYVEANAWRGVAVMLLARAELDLARSAGEALGPRVHSACEMLTEAITLFRKVEDATKEAIALLVMCRIQQRLGNAEQAQKAAVEAVKCYGVLLDRKGQAQALHEYAASQVIVSHFDEAMKACHKAGDMYKQLGDKRGQALELHSIATWQHERGDSNLAVGTAQDALELFRKIGCSGRWEAPTLGLLVELFIAISSPKQALQLAEDAIERYRMEGGREREVARILYHLVHVHLAMGNTSEALAAVERAQFHCQTIGDKYWESSVLHAKASVHSQDRDYDQAVEAVTLALTILEEAGGTKDEQAVFVNALMQVHIARETYPEAHAVALRHLELVQEAGGHRISEAHAILGTAVAYGLNGDNGRAEIATLKAQKLFNKLGDKRGESKAMRILSEIHRANGEDDEAVEAAEQGKALAREARDAKGQAAANEVLGEAFLATGQFSQAVKASKDATATLRSMKDFASASRLACLTVEGLLASLRETDSMTQEAIIKVRDDSMTYAKEAQRLAQQCGERFLQASANYWLAQCFLLHQRIQDAVKASEDAYTTFRKFKDWRGQVQTLTLLGTLHNRNEGREKARPFLEEASKLAKIHNDKESLEHIQQLLGQSQERTLPAKTVDAQAEVQAAGEGPKATAPIAYTPPDPAIVRHALVNMVVNMFGVDEGIDDNTPLMEAGLDSLASVEFRAAVSKEFGLPLPATVMFNYPSIGAITEMLIHECTEKQIAYS